MKILIITKAEYCPFCVKAKEILQEMNMKYEEMVIGTDIMRSDFLAMLPKGTPPTVPQIYIDGQHIGGCADLEMHVAELFGNTNEYFDM